MNDGARNKCYDEAIQRQICAIALDKGVDLVRVLDIGSGSGLLGMMAARAGAQLAVSEAAKEVPLEKVEVICCEKVEVLASVSCELVSNNGFDEAIRVANAFSTELTPSLVGWGGGDGSDNVSGGCDLVVTEIFGDQALSESVLTTMDHAVKELYRVSETQGSISSKKKGGKGSKVDSSARRIGPKCVPAAVRVICALARGPSFLRGQTELLTGHSWSAAMEAFVSPEVPLTPSVAKSLQWFTEPAVLFEVSLTSPSLTGTAAASMPILMDMGPSSVEGDHGYFLVHWFELQMDEEAVLTTAPCSLPAEWYEIPVGFALTVIADIPINDIPVKYDINCASKPS